MDSLWGELSARQTLSQLLTRLGNAVRTEPSLQNAWVVAELSDVRQAGPHCYMELIEKDELGRTVAKLRANIWQSSLPRLRHKFLAATGRDIATGIKVLVYGAVTHHNLYGLSFNITDIDPSYTLGDMERLRREILERLKREGLAENNRRLQLCPNPQRIAVISARNAAGYGDFMNQLHSNRPGFVFYTHLFEAVMQNERASATIRAALEQVEMTIDLWDCVVIIRGGGATTDLNGFDDYDLARAVATFPLPVIVGIGHERDRTVLDELANTRTKTPTAAAAFLIDRLGEAAERVATLADQLQRHTSEALRGARLQLGALQSALPAYAEALLQRAKTRLDATATAIPGLAASRIRLASQRIDNTGHLLDALCGSRIAAARQLLQNLASQTSTLVPLRMAQASERLKNLEAMVNVLSPEATLRRGYTLTSFGGKIAKSAHSIPAGSPITVRFADGSINATTTNNHQD